MFLNAVKNSMDPDQLASEKPADLDPNYFQNRTHDKVDNNEINAESEI